MSDIEYDPAEIAVSTELMFQILDVLSTAHVYILLGSEFQHELPQDFKPEKWRGYELDVAEQANQTYRKLLHELQQRFTAIKEDNNAD